MADENIGGAPLSRNLPDHGDRVNARRRANRPWGERAGWWLDDFYRQWEESDTRDTMPEGPGELERQ